MSPVPAELRMGDDIVRQHAHLPVDECIELIATHIQKFWDPRMRRRLLDLVAAGDREVDPLLAAAAVGLEDVTGLEVNQGEKKTPSGG